jgi:hypothetical protein
VKDAIASVEIFAHRGDEPVQRLSLVVGAPASVSAAGRTWICRVALANLHRAEEIAGHDSVEALTLALARGRDWLLALQASGFVLCRDRDGREPYRFD